MAKIYFSKYSNKIEINKNSIAKELNKIIEKILNKRI